LGAKQDFCSSIMGVKQDFCSTFVVQSKPLFKHLECKRKLCLNVFRPKSLISDQTFWVQKSKTSAQIFRCKALFKHFGPKQEFHSDILGTKQDF
jgi:hypothetical protein